LVVCIGGVFFESIFVLDEYILHNAMQAKPVQAELVDVRVRDEL
jgi:hypothetical protein